MTHGLVVFLHVLAISVWMAAALWVSGDVRRALALGRPHVEALPPRVRSAFVLDGAAAVATLVTGSLVMLEERLGMPRAGIIAGIVFTLARIGVVAVMRGAWKDLERRLAAGGPVEATDPAARRMVKLSGIAHALWLLALAGMVFPV